MNSSNFSRPFKMKFKLKFDKKNSLTVFALPQTNHYHTISALTIKPDNYQLINLLNNKVVVFDKQITSEIIFDAELKSYSHPSEKNYSKELAIIRKQYDFTLDYLTYGNPIDGLHSYKQAMSERITDCGGFSTYLAHLLHNQNITSRLVVGFLLKQNFLSKILDTLDSRLLTLDSLSMHAWLEAKLPDGSWFPLDSSIEWRRKNNLTKREGGFGYLPADRLVTSFGQDFKLNINGRIYQVDILQKPVYL